jgi:D-glycero-D-manno-heptose 1,7-bisphosphate phosphatase
LKRAVFLDRDGVINRAVVQDGKPFPPRSVAELEVLPDAHDALQRLRDAGYVLIVVTNQPDVARGTQSRAAVEEINARLANELAIDDFMVCYHDDAAGCSCRKPSPGGLLEAAARHGVDLGSSYIVGDRWRDVEAGQRAGCTSFFIDYGYSEREPQPPFRRVHSLAEAAEQIVTDAGRRLNDERR